jgi:hypothetical protein
MARSEPSPTPEALLAAVDRQTQAYSRLVTLSRQKQEILIGGDIHALAKLLPEEQAALVALQRIEALLSQAIAELACASGDTVGASRRPDRLPDLAALEELLPPPWGAELSERRRTLAGLSHELTVLVESNGELIRRARAFIEFSLHQAAQAAGAAGYSSSGARRLATSAPAAGQRY